MPGEPLLGASHFSLPRGQNTEIKRATKKRGASACWPGTQGRAGSGGRRPGWFSPSRSGKDSLQRPGCNSFSLPRDSSVPF